MTAIDSIDAASSGGAARNQATSASTTPAEASTPSVRSGLARRLRAGRRGGSVSDDPPTTLTTLRR